MRWVSQSPTEWPRRSTAGIRDFLRAVQPSRKSPTTRPTARLPRPSTSPRPRTSRTGSSMMCPSLLGAPTGPEQEEALAAWIDRPLGELEDVPPATLRRHRHDKFRAMLHRNGPRRRRIGVIHHNLQHLGLTTSPPPSEISLGQTIHHQEDHQEGPAKRAKKAAKRAQPKDQKAAKKVGQKVTKKAAKKAPAKKVTKKAAKKAPAKKVTESRQKGSKQKGDQESRQEGSGRTDQESPRRLRPKRHQESRQEGSSQEGDQKGRQEGRRPSSPKQTGAMTRCVPPAGPLPARPGAVCCPAHGWEVAAQRSRENEEGNDGHIIVNGRRVRVVQAKKLPVKKARRSRAVATPAPKPTASRRPRKAAELRNTKPFVAGPSQPQAPFAMKLGLGDSDTPNCRCTWRTLVQTPTPKTSTSTWPKGCSPVWPRSMRR